MPPCDPLFEPWRYDMQAQKPAVEPRKDRRTASGQDIGAPAASGPVIPTIQFFLDGKKFNKFLRDGGESPETPCVAKSGSHEVGIIPVRKWLNIVIVYPEAACVDFQALKEKFEDANFMDCPVSLLNSLKNDLEKEFKMTLVRQRGFIIRALEIYFSRKGW